MNKCGPAPGPDGQRMREELIRLCSDAEGHLEAHYADMLAAFDNPLDHLGRFPYFSNYIDLSKLEFDLLVRYIPGLAPSRVAFVGSGPLPFSSLVLAARHLPNTLFDNYDRCGAANDRARKLVRADKDLNARMSFHTVDVASPGPTILRAPGRIDYDGPSRLYKFFMICSGAN
jgi:nicotianamine synthase